MKPRFAGPSQALPHPRALAADALGAIGGDAADAALTRALEDSTDRALNPQFREAEAVVVSRIVAHLSRHHRQAAVEALLESMRERPGPACAQALGELRDPRAIPLLIQSLGEDAAREAAMKALRHFGRAPLLRLRAALACPHYVSGTEPPRGVEARAAAATLLGELGAQSPLLLALEDQARAVRVAAAMSLVQFGEIAPPRALEILVQALDDPNWAVAEAIIGLLAQRRPSVETLLEEALRDSAADEPSLRRHRRAAVLAGRFGIAHAAPILAALSESNDSALRFAAVHALAQIGTATEEELVRFLPDSVLGIASEALRAVRARRSFSWLEVSIHLKAAPAWRAPWRRWQRLWTLRSVSG